MKTRNRAKNIERVRKVAATQNEREDILWLDQAANGLFRSLALLKKRARILGIALPFEPEQITDSPSAPADRFYALRSTFWQLQSTIATALDADVGVTEATLADVAMLKTVLAQTLSFDFRGTGMDISSIDQASIQSQVGTLVASKRGGKGLTQTALGKAIGLSSQSINRIEAGKQRITMPALYAIAKALTVPVTDLIPREMQLCAEQLSRDQVKRFKAALPGFARALDRREKELDSRRSTKSSPSKH